MKTTIRFESAIRAAAAAMVASLAICGIAGCNDDDANNDAAGDGGQALSDSQIASVMVAANAGEVMTGQLAIMHAQDDDVESLATMIMNDHTMANTRLTTLAQTASLTTDTDSAQRQMVQQMGMQALTTLQATPDPQFDAAFVTAQIALHTSVLNMLDAMLIPRAKNAQLKAELQMERQAVQMHLTHAQMISTR